MYDNNTILLSALHMYLHLYAKNYSDWLICLDINECIPNGGLGPCQQNCTNTIGSFICSCQSGYTSSGYNCTGMIKYRF